MNLLPLRVRVDTVRENVYGGPMRKLLSLFLLTLGLLCLVTAPSLADPPDKVTICHAAGLDGTTHYVTLEISHNAVYGPGGHFNENGTPQAGHEDDYLGPCIMDETTTTTVEDTTSTTATTVEESTTTTLGETSTDSGLVVRRSFGADGVEELPRTGEATAVLAGLGVALVLAGAILAMRYRMDRT